MKLWQRFCLWPLSFFLVIFLGTGVLLIEQNTRQVFELNLNQLSEEQKSITEGLNWYIYTSSVRDSRRGLERQMNISGNIWKTGPESGDILSDNRGR